MAIIGNFYGVFIFKIKNRTTVIQQSHFWVYTWRNEIDILKTCLHPCVYCGIVYNSQGMETTQLSTDEGMDKENATFMKARNAHMRLSLEQLTHCKVKNLLVT